MLRVRAADKLGSDIVPAMRRTTEVHWGGGNNGSGPTTGGTAGIGRLGGAQVAFALRLVLVFRNLTGGRAGRDFHDRMDLPGSKPQALSDYDPARDYGIGDC
jgi:hypothetical protein